MCGCCVERFDHHCIWINQCVGLNNYKYFLSFLVLHAWLCTYGVFAGFQIARGVCEKEGLWHARFLTSEGLNVPADIFVIAQYILG